MYFDRFDIVAAYYAFACDWHSGQFCPLYLKLCRIESYFNPGILWKGYDSLTENGQVIYDQLAANRLG